MVVKLSVFNRWLFRGNCSANVGNTNGKVILQTFSFDALNRSYNVFQGQLPLCYLLWISSPAYATDIAYDTPTGYADFIKYAQDHGATIIGPAIAGAPCGPEADSWPLFG